MGLFESLFGSGGEGEYNNALQELQNVPLPILKEYYPELYQKVVSLNPEMEQAVSMGPSEMAGIGTDPALRKAQMSALAKLSGIGEAGGQDAQFIADSARLISDVNTENQGREAAIQQNLAARGMGGGMSELVQRNLSSQAAANRQAQAGLDLKAQAEQRALQAMMQSGQLAGQMQGQDFQQSADKAKAADLINQFNAQNRQQVGSRNVQAKNAAQEYNANSSQNVANMNTQTRNQAQQYNLGLDQQQFNNRVSKATGVANQYNQIGASKDKDRDREASLIGNIVSGGFQSFGPKPKMQKG